MFRTGLSADERNMPLFYRNEGGAMIRTNALGNEGQGGGGKIDYSLLDGLRNEWAKRGIYTTISKNGYLTYWMGGEKGDSNTSEEMVANMFKIADGSSDNAQDWYSPGGKANWVFGTSATALGYVEGSFRLTNGAYNGNAWSPKYYSSAWRGGSRARISTYNIGKIGKTLGKYSFYLGVAMDVYGVKTFYEDPNSPNAVDPKKATLNTVMGYVGLKGGAYGAIISTLYFGVDNYYPGGWVGASETAAATEVYEQHVTGHPFLNNSAIKF